MAVRIRLKKVGKKNDASFRIAILPQTSGRDSATIEEIGFYDPRRSNESVNVERYDYWVSVGAIPSDTVKAIVNRAKAGKSKTLADFKAEVAARESAKPTKRRARKAAPVAEVEAPVEGTETPAEVEAPAAE